MRFLEKAKKLRLEIIHNFYLKKRIKKNKIIVWSDSFRNYGCNPKYIVLYLLEYYPRAFDIVWVFDQNRDIPDLPKEVRVVKYFSLEYLYEISTAKFIICNSRTSDAYFFKKRREQFYIQTWHSSIRLKKIERDVETFLSQKYVRNAIEDSKKIDLIISGCDFSTRIFKNSFWYNGKVLKSGTPRSDVLLSSTNEIRKKVFKYYSIPMEKKLVLYAPTFRADKKADLFGFDFHYIKEVLNDEYVYAYRLHPNILENINEIEGIISMNMYPDMQELLCACDMLITDYSSSMFDMAISRKKCFLYAPDLENYLEKERNLYFDIYNLPFSLAKNMNELCDNILNFDINKYLDKIELFLNSIGSYEDGHATERIVEIIMREMEKQ